MRIDKVIEDFKDKEWKELVKRIDEIVKMGKLEDERRIKEDEIEVILGKGKEKEVIEKKMDEDEERKREFKIVIKNGENRKKKNRNWMREIVELKKKNNEIEEKIIKKERIKKMKLFKKLKKIIEKIGGVIDEMLIIENIERIDGGNEGIENKEESWNGVDNRSIRSEIGININIEKGDNGRNWGIEEEKRIWKRSKIRDKEVMIKGVEI